MSQWIISVPVWGERYLSVFERATMPALKAAIAELAGHQVTLIVHTDLRQADRVTAAVGGAVDLQLMDVPPDDWAFESLSQSHRQVIHLAPPNSRVSLLTADLVVSRKSFISCENLFGGGSIKIIGCAGMRAVDEGSPPIGATGRELLAWGWDNRHPMTQECTWPEGTSYDLWRMYFAKDDEVCCRLCLPHPFAFIHDRGFIDFRPTIDVNLVSHFSLGETYLVTNPDEVAMIELSPREKEFLRTEPFWKRYRDTSIGSIPSIVHLTHARHHWMLSHKIIIKGTGGDCGDDLVTMRMIHGQ